MRVTENLRIAHATSATTSASSRAELASQVASSGNRMSAPSDDAAGWSAVVRLDGRLSLVQGRQTAATRASSDLDLAEGALASATDVLVRAREIAVQMSNGAVDAKTRADMAGEVLGLRDQLVALANTKGATGYVFSGNKTLTAAFDAQGNFQGDDGVRNVEIADGVVARSNASGAKAFTAAGGRDVMADLQALATALSQNNVASVQSAIGLMESDQQQVTSARVDAGLASERLHSAGDVMAQTILSMQKARSSEADADAVSAYSELVAATTAYQRAVEVTRQVLSLSSVQRTG